MYYIVDPSAIFESLKHLLVNLHLHVKIEQNFSNVHIGIESLKKQSDGDGAIGAHNQIITGKEMVVILTELHVTKG